MVKDYEVLYNTTPTLDEYISLCSSVGWKDFMNFDVAETSLRNTVFSVIIKDNNKVIGMGRIVGDGAIYYYIQDIVVHPKYQGYGIGKEIMNTLMSYIENNAPNKAFIGLFASEGKVDFYKKYGFKDYSPNMTGMFKVNLK
ncbi:Acetyltransferase (GNAT) domain-containing protein [Gracilibacillus orientalis]|uniref:Acetyltransferase (GNAT) domain-containing protein n=1 Tax=Gracilibacillus orientalis TaxID=334253 RepID=A0A1I4MY78_9BACI|nr:GNAT family N-acetyltransferase [Gracilibacillus orientalis]SFM08168.1 Acetyltransferase (GNAT) domain-containing protein [Gracilibacillus orientalis]